jgi:hypothetical protein
MGWVVKGLAAVAEESKVIVKASLLATSATKVTVGAVLSVTLSLESLAVKVAIPAVVDFAVKVTTPFASEVVPATAAMVSVAPLLEVSATVLPATGLLLLSSRVTVIVEEDEPFATTVVGERVTVETDALTLAALTTIPDCEPVILLVTVSLAVTLWVPAVFKFTPLVNVCAPESAVTKV